MKSTQRTHTLLRGIALHNTIAAFYTLDAQPTKIRANIQLHRNHDTCLLTCALNQHTAITDALTITWAPRGIYHSDNLVLGATRLVLLPHPVPRRIDLDHIQFDCQILRPIAQSSLSKLVIYIDSQPLTLHRYLLHSDAQCIFERKINQEIAHKHTRPARLVVSSAEHSDQIAALQAGQQVALEPPQTSGGTFQWIIKRVHRTLRPDRTNWDLHLEQMQ